MEGTKEMAGNEVMVKIIKEQDKLSRTEIETGFTTGFVMVTDRDAWTYFPLRSPSADQISAEDLPALQTEMDIAGPLVDYVAKGHKAELVGKDAVEGNTCYKIKLTTKTGMEMMFWVDTSTHLLSQSSAVKQAGGPGSDKENLTLYKDYRNVEGIMFAHSYETKSGKANEGSTSGEISFYNILINPSIDPKKYQPE